MKNLFFQSQKGEPIILCDMPLSTQWNFEVNWCPRNPFLISTSSFDSRATIYSLSGGQPAAPTSNKVTFEKAMLPCLISLTILYF